MMRFVSCSCDNSVQEWIYVHGTWIGSTIGSHDEWVRDVSWASNDLGVTYDRVVSGGEDNKVKIWTKQGADALWQQGK